MISNKTIIPKTIVYFADCLKMNDDDIFNKFYEKVSRARKDKIDRFCHRKDKNLSLCAEYLFMCGCKDFGIDYENEEIYYGEHQKPYFLNKNIYFNISHSEEKVMCVMSECEVGCDVEKVRNVNFDIANRFFLKSEIEELDMCSNKCEKENLFFRIWTLKESFVKCLGIGIPFKLNSFSILEKGTFKDHIKINTDVFSFLELDNNDDYRYAICIKNGNTKDITIKEKEIMI